MSLQGDIEKLDLMPRNTRVIVKEEKVEQYGSIVIPKSTKATDEMRATEGVVLAIGKDVEETKVGDEIYYGRYSGTMIKRNDEIYWLMNEDDILCNKKSNGGGQ